ncbi:MAG TPA: Yip1 family protein [Gaiellaceae bacterium]|nr:Yip1 family protein [Gaiellaceae bacterium]
MSVRALPAPADERVWLRRAVTVLVRPREVFEGIRDDSETAARVRSEAVLALIMLAGIASVLWTPTYGRLQDDVANDALNVAVIAFVGGSLYGALGYFLGGLVLYALTRVIGGASYRQVRHVLAFAAAPVALSLLVVWPVRLAVYGSDVFRSGGADHGAGNDAFLGAELLFAVWSLVLLVLGLRIVLRREPGFERL